MFCRLNMEYTLVRSQYSFLANQMTERSWRCSSASIICPMCIMVLGMKKGGTIRNLFYSEVPPSTVTQISTNSSRPIGRELSVTYSRVSSILAVFRIENKS